MPISRQERIAELPPAAAVVASALIRRSNACSQAKDGPASIQSAKVSRLRQVNVVSAQDKLRRRYAGFCRLLPPITQLPKPMHRSEFARFLEDLYAARYMQDAQQLRAEAAGEGGEAGTSHPPRFPIFVVAFVETRYGLKQVVGQFCWNLVHSVDEFRESHAGAELFARFLEEVYDSLDLLFLLHTRGAVRRAMLTDNRKSMNCSDWQTVWNATPNLAGKQLVSAIDAGPPRNLIDAKQAIQVVRHIVGQRELQESMLQRLNSEMLRSKSGGSISKTKSCMEVEKFLLLTTEDFHRGRGEAGNVSDKGDRLLEIVEALHSQWGDINHAFHQIDVTGCGTITYSDFAQAVRDIGCQADIAHLWEIIDENADGAVSEQEFMTLQQHADELLGAARQKQRSEQSDSNDSAGGNWDPNLEPQVIKQAQLVEQRLLASLAERGGAAARPRPEEIRGWAVGVARNRQHPGQPPGWVVQRGDSQDQAEDSQEYMISPEEMQSAWWKLHDVGITPRDHDAELSPGDDLEAAVRELLVSNTQELVCEAVALASEERGLQLPGSARGRAAATGLDPAVDALMAEFAPTTDALMQALVNNNCEAWLHELGSTPPGSEAQRWYFKGCYNRLNESLNSRVNTRSVDRICRVIVSAPELRAAVRARANVLLESAAAMAPHYRLKFTTPRTRMHDKSDLGAKVESTEGKGYEGRHRKRKTLAAAQLQVPGTSAALEPAAKSIQAAFRRYSGRTTSSLSEEDNKDSRRIQARFADDAVGDSTSNDLKVTEKRPPIFTKKSEWSEVASQNLSPPSASNVIMVEEVKGGHERDAAEEATVEDKKKGGVSVDHHPTTDFKMDGQQPHTPAEEQAPIPSEPSPPFSEPTVAATNEQGGTCMTATDNLAPQEEATEQSWPQAPQEVIASVAEDGSQYEPDNEEDEDAF